MVDYINTMCQRIKILFPLWICEYSTTASGVQYIYIANTTVDEFYSAFPKAKQKSLLEFSYKYNTMILPFDGNKFHIVIEDDTNLNKLNINEPLNVNASPSIKDFAEICSFFRKNHQWNCSHTISNVRPRYIIIKDLNIKHFIDVYPYATFSKEKFSQQYKTTFITINGHQYPVVIKDHSNFIDEKRMFKDKYLSPANLNIEGVFFEKHELQNTIIAAIDSLKTQIKEDSRIYALNILLSIVKEKPLSESQKIVYDENKNIIDKDFGELLCGLYYLNENKVKCIEFPVGTSSSFYDLIVTYNGGYKKKINTKSGKSSGQSFGCILLERIKKYNDAYQPVGIDAVYLNVIEILVLHQYDKYSKGIDTMLKVADEFRKCDDILGRTIDSLFRKFINYDNFLEKGISISDYNKYLSMFVENAGGNKVVGQISDKFKVINNQETLNKYLVFSISSLIRKYSNSKILTKIMASPFFSTVITCYFSYNKDGDEIKVIEYSKNKAKYKFHYWGSISRPTNNMLGYKIFY